MDSPFAEGCDEACAPPKGVGESPKSQSKEQPTAQSVLWTPNEEGTPKEQREDVGAKIVMGIVDVRVLLTDQ